MLNEMIEEENDLYQEDEEKMAEEFDEEQVGLEQCGATGDNDMQYHIQ